MAGNLITADYQNNKVRQHSGFTTTISQSFSKTGVYWAYYDAVAGTVYFSADVNVSARSVKKGTGFTGTVSASFTAPQVEDVYDVDFDASGNIMLGQNKTKVTRQSGFSATVLDSFTMAVSIRGICWDGTNVMVTQPATKAFKNSGFSSTVSSSFTTNAPNQGQSWDGTNFIANRSTTAKYRRHSGFSSTISSSIAYETGKTAPTGLDWDGYPEAPAASTVSIISDIIMFN